MQIDSMTIPFGSHISRSSEETFRFGQSIGELLKFPVLFLLEGNLGVGKTVFAKGLICGLGQKDPDDVPSPSFTLINEYNLRFKIYHIDLFRLETDEDLRSLDLEEIFCEPAVIIVEWAEKLGKLILENTVRVGIEDLGGDMRQIVLTALGDGDRHTQVD